ncbi:helix-turn-helix transcriptional regulator [Cohnella fermenti]|uniref:Uncharacterized protein n=1 Tax=Cohnella fermenti TaxID=2565925 RepID=A0A4S4C8A5_9BACL|nr:helix-turn-helix transcriptional regulator [Cohnella fermenti]THF84253.1 hypothetical protein E6C55_02875 [Cohnella fermenti]
MELNQPKISNGLIIWLTILFFPLAILLILIRFLAHANVNHLRDKDYEVTGHFFTWMWLVWSVIIIVINYWGENVLTPGELVVGLMIVAAVLLTPAFVFYGLGKRRRAKMQERYRIYARLAEGGVADYNEIAARTGIRYRDVEQDMRYIQQLKGLTGNGLEAVSGERRSDPNPVSGIPDAGGAASRPAAASPRAVVCQGCGSSTMVLPGESRECEFCGNELTAS